MTTAAEAWDRAGPQQGAGFRTGTAPGPWPAAATSPSASCTPTATATSPPRCATTPRNATGVLPLLAITSP
jgi:hypothetical protein